MKAYAILDGGGVKGAALAGCLKAAEQRGIEFIGYGGTSAGAIMALLGSLGFSGNELERIAVEDIEFSKFLDDAGDSLADLKALGTELSATGWFKWSKRAKAVLKRKALLGNIAEKFGLYHADQLTEFLRGKIKEKLPQFKNKTDITFQDLKDAGCCPLKIVATDVRLGTAITFSAAGGEERNGSVLAAVRASMSYPFVFRPVVMGNSYYVDGGVSINLPVHLFAEDNKADGIPVLAFDLIAPPAKITQDYTFNSFVGDMLSTTIEASERLLRRATNGIYHIEVRTDPSIKTLDFDIDETQRKRLFHNGYNATQEYFSTTVKHWFSAKNHVEKLQALYADPDMIQYLLSLLCEQVGQKSPAQDVRAQIMLPTPSDTRIVTYHWGMNDDPDIDLELELNAGATGAAWEAREVSFANLGDLSEVAGRGLTPAQQNKVRKDRRAMMCAPIFRLTSLASPTETVESLGLLGTLSVDTSTLYEDTEWGVGSAAETILRLWADVFGKLLSV